MMLVNLGVSICVVTVVLVRVYGPNAGLLPPRNFGGGFLVREV